MHFNNKLCGCYWGLALGDALGKPVEFESIESIQKKYGESGIQSLEEGADWTDDTEMTFAITKALLRLGAVEDIAKLHDETIGRVFAEEFIEWFNNPGHAPGITTMTSVAYLIKNGADKWRQAGENDSKGSGTVMRAAPLGVWFAKTIGQELPAQSGENHSLLKKISTIQSEITHGHKAATAAALAGSYAVALAFNDITPVDMIAPIQSYCGSIDADFDNAMLKLTHALQNRKNKIYKTDLEAVNSIGQGWVGDEAFAMALYAVIRHPSDFKKCLQISVNHSGDSDSVACIAGSILGAFNGFDIIPQDWKKCLAEKTRMDQLLTRIKNFFKK
jgi:ADP-ribosylglycohydrolase